MDDRLKNELSGLREMAPSAVLPAVLVEAGLADGFVIHRSVLGPLYVAFSKQGISSVDIAATPEAFAERFRERFGRPTYATEKVPAALSASLARTLETGRTGKIPLDLSGLSPFCASVLRKAAEIPPGEVRPYSWVAREIGNPKAVRAVGGALAANPVPLLVPCHRVVRSDGRLGRYSLGEDENKRRLLEAEGLATAAQEQSARRGVRLLGSDTTHIFCYPSCRHARRIGESHRVEFNSARQAEGLGYRACRDCRPVAA